MSKYKINRKREGSGVHGEMMTSAKKLYLCAFLIPVLIAVLICIRNEVYPFGENCILHIDMYHQYEPFFTELMDKLKNGGSLLYSWNIGLGSDFVSLFAYYLASPLNWFLLLCPVDHVIEFMTLLILLKIGLCGLNFAVYLREHFGNTDLAGAVFAAFYALSGYMAAYSWDIMWLDCVALAPIVLLGLEKLVKEKKCGLYCLSLGVCILSNFYISIMICIFLVLYFVILFLEELHTGRERLESLGRFTLYSLLAGGMGAVLIIPEAMILSYSGSSGISFPDTTEWYFNLIEELARHCMDVEVYTGRDHWPNLYCGAAIFLFLILYLLNGKISGKKKVKRVALIVFFWISFANNMLDFIWHGLHFPDSLPGRQSFLYIFLLLVIACETCENREGNSLIHIGIAILLSYGFLILAANATDAGMVTGDALIMTAVLIGGYGMLFALWHMGGEDMKVLARFLVLVLAVIEVYANFSATGLSTTSRTSYTKNWESVKELLAQLDSRESEPFYRAEEMERLTKNDAAIYGYSSSTIFSSLMNIGVSNFYRRMGMEGGKNFYSYSGSTPLSSAMLSVKYLISRSPYEESPLRTLIAGDGQNYIYQNLYTLPLGFMVDSEFEEQWNPQKGMPIANLNRMAKVSGAREDLLLPFHGDVSADEDKTRVTVTEDCYLYATYSDTTVTNITITNQERVRKFNKCDHGYILDLGWCQAGDTVEIDNTSDVSCFQVQVYRLNMDALNDAYETLNAQTLELDTFTDTRVEGHITADEPGSLVLSVPQENGWSVFVDGKEAVSETFMESLIEIPLTEGEHQITLKYMTPGLKQGAAISLISLLLFCMVQAGKRRSKK